jgi:hypothetical protein
LYVFQRRRSLSDIEAASTFGEGRKGPYSLRR